MPPSLPRNLLTTGNTCRLLLNTSRKTLVSKSNPFPTQPAPPLLPPEEQALFERLQKASTGAFSTPRPEASSTPSPSGTGDSTNTAMNAQLEVTMRGGELHPDVRGGAKPEFEGEVNPKTGEVGGPKNEPLRWGQQGDWSYNGRVTDF